MGMIKKQNSTTFNRCPKDTEHPFVRVPAKWFTTLDIYQFAIMAHIISNKDGWNLVKKEIMRRVGYSEWRFKKAWSDLQQMGYIQIIPKYGSYHYNIFEDPDYTTCNSTSCTGTSLTTINNNYYNTGESSDSSINSNKADSTSTIISDLHSQFEELKNLFPKEVIRPDGKRDYLKTGLELCEELYTKYLSEGLLSHTEVLKCLEVEINVRNQTGKMPYIKRFVKWLKVREFEAYQDRVDQPVYGRYGTELVV